MAPRVPGLFITGTDTGVGKTYVTAMIARSLVKGGRRVGVYKPAASGCRLEGQHLVSDDAVALWEAAGRPGELDRLCPQRFLAPLAPHLAAQQEASNSTPAAPPRARLLARPGGDCFSGSAGGLMSPLGETDYVADLATEFGFPLVVVTRNALGTINQTLQTLIAARTFCGREKGLSAKFRETCGAAVSAAQDVAVQGAGETPAPQSWRRAEKGIPMAGVVLNHVTLPSTDDASLATNRRELAARCAVPILAEVAWRGESFDAPVDTVRTSQAG